jgi:hypothetical protein
VNKLFYLDQVLFDRARKEFEFNRLTVKKTITSIFGRTQSDAKLVVLIQL